MTRLMMISAALVRPSPTGLRLCTLLGLLFARLRLFVRFPMSVPVLDLCGQL